MVLSIAASVGCVASVSHGASRGRPRRLLFLLEWKLGDFVLTDPVVHRIEALIDKGDLADAYDLATRAVVSGPAKERIKFLRVLSLARMGATEEALLQYKELGLGGIDDLDCVALRARLLKDSALASWPNFRIRDVREAADQYLKVYRRYRDPFPGVNAATLYRIAGDPGNSRALAKEISILPCFQNISGYWMHVTLGECLLLIEKPVEARKQFLKAIDTKDYSRGKVSSTLRQLSYLLSQINEIFDIINHFFNNGSSFCFNFAPEENVGSGVIRSFVEKAVRAQDIYWAYGCLTSDAELICAEALLEQNVSLTLFISNSPDGKQGPGQFLSVDQARFEICRRRSARVVAIDTANQKPEVTIEFLRQLARGHSRIRAKEMMCRSFSIRSKPDGLAIFEDKGQPSGEVLRVAGSPTVSGNYCERRVLSFLFADFAGFGKLSESDMPDFWQEIMGNVSRSLDGLGDHVVYKNTWGDACFAAFDTAESAAEAALSIQERLHRNSRFRNGAMRLSLHRGAVFVAEDPVVGRLAPFGSEISKAARIEPVAVPGQIFVSEAFAASIAAETDNRFTLNYLGRRPLAKNAGEERLYRLGKHARDAYRSALREATDL